MMWRLVFGPSRFCAPDAMFLGEGTRHFGCRFGLRISLQSFNVSKFQSFKEKALVSRPVQSVCHPVSRILKQLV
jgi:hypothetical protein